jgi:hypothetical protein
MEIVTIESFIEYYGKIRTRTMQVISSIPKDKIEWTYAAGKLTFGDVIRHIASIERYMYAENMLGKPSRYPGCGTDLASGFDETLAFMNRCHRDSLSIFKTLTPAGLKEKCVTPGGAPITKWKWLRDD